MLRFAVLVATTLLALTHLEALGQNLSPRVAVEKDLRFGVIKREQSRSVASMNDSAALFAIWGEPERSVLLGLTVEPLDGSSQASMNLELDMTACSMSLDGGVTWENVDLPAGLATRFGTAAPGSTEAVIFVRVGGSISASDTQRRGDYAGSITLTAAYGPDAVRPGVPAMTRRSPAAPPAVTTTARSGAATIKRADPCPPDAR
jgi:hypothetical protein